MSLQSLHAQLEAADAQYIPPEFLDFSGVCDPSNPALSDHPVNFPVKRYRLILTRLDAYAMESSQDSNLVYQVALFRAAVLARLSSTDQLVRTMYLRHVLRTLSSSNPPLQPPSQCTPPLHAPFIAPSPLPSYSHDTPHNFPISPLFRNLPPNVSDSYGNSGNNGNNGNNGINGSNGCHLPSPVATQSERPIGPSSSAQISSNNSSRQNLDRVVILPTNSDYNRLNDQYSFESATSLANFDFTTFNTNGRQRLVKDRLCSLLTKFHFWQVNHLLAICKHHGIPEPVARQRSMPTLYHLLRAHECSTTCSNTLYVFTCLTKCRSLSVLGSKERFIAALESSQPVPTAAVPGLHAPSPDFKRRIIQDWQDEMSTANQRNGVCASCSKSERAVLLKELPVEEVDLSLLSNDDIPDHLLPVSYNVTAYEKALLNVKGMSHPQRKEGVLKVCAACHTSLKEGKIPKFALANHLYFAQDRLPADTSAAFTKATLLERFLVSRARASKITFRYCQKPDAPGFGGSVLTSQSYNKGNVIVYPQDSLSLNKVLPPSPQSVKDTFCALVIGASQKASRETIAELRPCLLRKTRVKTMIDFLVRHNPFYKEDDEFSGFSDENLDALVDELGADGNSPDREVAPSCIEVTQLDPTITPGEFEATADYTNRNVAEPHDNADEDLSDILLENVGFADADMSPADYRTMKLKAMQHCLAGGKYVQSRTGSAAVRDFDNPKLLSWLFPHLDPWGIGGFHHPLRRRKLSMELQLSHLLSIDDSPFASDPTFAFVYWSILQKKEVAKDCSFRLKQSQFERMTNELAQIPAQTLTELERKLQICPGYRPESPPECAALKILSQLSVMNTHLRGSSGSKITMRNEIRSLIQTFGVPALFITLNPSDVNNPLVRLIIGEDIVLEDELRGEDLSKFMRQKLAAKYPNATAKFFDRMIKTFFDKIVRYGSAEPGLFGRCTAYYGTVEAQGKGTLHCHILLWLDDHLAPQALRDKMLSDDSFKRQMFEYLESIIKCELPENTEVVSEGPDGNLQTPSRPPGVPNPAVLALPLVRSMPPAEFDSRFRLIVSDLAKEFHWHYHNNTCWKYLKRGDPKDDAHCRMRINGETRAQTELDPETHSILLRRLHPRINCYNDMLTFLFQSNNDIKFIGSGEAAKALTYYVTDYITKSPLPTHIGLSALRAAIQNNAKKYDANSTATPEQVSKSLITKCANAILSRQEISHPQVMSYLIGGGDHYTSHTFETLYWASIHKVVSDFFEPVTPPVLRDNTGVSENEEDTDPAAAETNDSSTPDEQSEPLVTVRMTSTGLSASKSSQYCDYIYRTDQAPFDSFSLYDFMRRTKKVILPKATTRGSSRNPTRHDQDSNEADLSDVDAQPSGARTLGGRPSNARGRFTASHPQFATHQLKERSLFVVPVVLGPTIPHPDKGAASRELWSKAMLILFKPWRQPLDLKSERETWSDAFERSEFDDDARRFMANFTVLHECKDARNNDMAMRELASFARSDQPDDRLSNQEIERDAVDGEGDAMDFLADAGLADDQADDDVGEVVEMDHNVAAVLLALHPGLPLPSSDNTSEDTSAILLTDGPSQDLLKRHRKVMAEYRKRKREDPEDEDDANADMAHPSRRRRLLGVEPVVGTNTLDDTDGVTSSVGPLPGSTTGRPPIPLPRTPLQHINDVVREMNLESNEEQLRAFKIVAHHFLDGTDQLLMHLGGVGGTGKSHVISAVVQLLERLGRSRELLLSAPTGAAAVLIGGSTIHSLTGLPGPSCNVEDLMKIWRHVRYLFIDEISMVHARLLAQISERIRKGKGGGGNSSRELPFGGVNIIFTGDFGQLKPVGGPSFFSNELLGSLRVATSESLDGQTALMGAFLWRQVNTVVILKQNQRQKEDPTYAGMLSRLRVGACDPAVNVGPPTFQTDFDLLIDRTLHRLRDSDPATADQFYDAPFIVGRRKIRDVLNRQLLCRAATMDHKLVFAYRSVDKTQGIPLHRTLQQAVWATNSTDCGDALGMLELFEGMKVMITENIAINKFLVNGAEGTVRKILYDIDLEGHRYATACYVHVPGSGIAIPGEEPDVACILPTTTSFFHRNNERRKIRIARTQLPLVPGYAYTDYKSQGRTLQSAVVDLASAGSLQGCYVMLSRVKALHGVAILRKFDRAKIEQRPSQEIREELIRLERLHEDTAMRYRARFESEDDWESMVTA